MDRQHESRGVTLTRRALLSGGVTIGLIGCGSEPAPRQPDPSPAASEPAAPASPWRFVPSLEAHLPAGAVAQTVLELSQPRRRAVVIVAAVLRADAEHVELERWTFTQSPDGESLVLVEGGEALVRLRPGPRHPQLGDVRRDMAAPRVVLTRPVGLPADGPAALLEQLSTAIGVLHDAKAEPRARVQAAATVVRGLDDAVVFERDAVWEVAELLDPAPAELAVEVLAERRARATVTLPHGTAMLELQRKSEGWAISSVDRPAAAIVEPEPTSGGSTGEIPAP